MAREKEPHGAKLTKTPEIELKVMQWILDDKYITDYEISKRLLEKHKFEISEQSLKAWRENYYEKALETYKEKLLAPPTSEDDIINKLKLNSLKDLCVYKQEIDILYKNLYKIISDKNITRAGFYNKDDYSLLKDYMILLLAVQEKINKQTGNISPQSICEDVIGRVVELIVPLLVEHPKELDIAQKKIKDLQEDLKVQYLFNRIS